MTEVVSKISFFINKIYAGFLSIFPNYLELPIRILIFMILLAVISIFIWYFYKSLSQCNILELKLGRYNRSKHPFFSKFFAVLLYLAEYILIMPIIITIWFIALAIILILLSEGQSVQQILIIAASLVGAVRILSYFNHELAQEIAKLFPFIILSGFLISPSSLNFSGTLVNSSELNFVYTGLFEILGVVIFLEIIMRIFHTFKQFFYSIIFSKESPQEEYSGN